MNKYNKYFHNKDYLIRVEYKGIFKCKILSHVCPVFVMHMSVCYVGPCALVIVCSLPLVT